MQKSTYLIGFACITGISDSAVAGTTGIYVGPMAGWSTVHVSSEVISGTAPEVGNDGTIVAQSKKKPNTFLTGGLIGWGFKSGCLYAGIEVDGFYSDISKNIIVDNTFVDSEIFHIKNKYQIGAGTRFGIVKSINTCTWIMPYVRMGLQVGKYQFGYTAKDASIPEGSFLVKKSKNVIAITPAIGIEFMFKDMIGVRIEGRYSPRFTERFQIGAIPGGSVFTFEHKKLYISPSQRSMMVSAVYYI